MTSYANQNLPAAGALRPLLTVVTATYNRRIELEHCIRSVLSQGVPGIVMHVFDNASNDETEAFMLELVEREPRVKYTRREENIGALANIANGIHQVTTDFFLILADDDYLLPGFLAAGLPMIQSDGELGSVVMQTVHIEAGEVICVNPDARWEFGRFSPAGFMKQWLQFGHFEWHSIIFRTTARDAVGGLDMEVGLPADVDFQAQVFLRFPTLVCEYRAAVFVMHPLQVSRGMGPFVASGYARMMEKFAATAKGVPELQDFGASFRNRCAGQVARMGWRCDSAGELIQLCGVILLRFHSPVNAIGALARWVAGRVGMSPRPASTARSVSVEQPPN